MKAFGDRVGIESSVDVSETGLESRLQGEATRIQMGGKSQGMEEKLGLLTETGGGTGVSGQRELRGRIESID